MEDVVKRKVGRPKGSPKTGGRPIAVARNEAIANGEKVYFDGIPCPHNHNVGRYVVNNVCIECNKINRTKQRNLKKEQYRISSYKLVLKNKYNIDYSDYLNMLEKQNNKCAICQEIFKLNANVDHCHITGKIRGLLCQPCNVGLGFFKDDRKRLEKAIEYLNEQPDN